MVDGEGFDDPSGEGAEQPGGLGTREAVLGPCQSNGQEIDVRTNSPERQTRADEFDSQEIMRSVSSASTPRSPINATPFALSRSALALSSPSTAVPILAAQLSTAHLTDARFSSRDSSASQGNMNPSRSSNTRLSSTAVVRVADADPSVDEAASEAEAEALVVELEPAAEDEEDACDVDTVLVVPDLGGGCSGRETGEETTDGGGSEKCRFGARSGWAGVAGVALAPYEPLL